MTGRGPWLVVSGGCVWRKESTLESDGVQSEQNVDGQGRMEAAPLVQGAGCSACVGFRYYPFLRSCAYWWNQYALAL